MNPGSLGRPHVFALNHRWPTLPKLRTAGAHILWQHLGVHAHEATHCMFISCECKWVCASADYRALAPCSAWAVSSEFWEGATSELLLIIFECALIGIESSCSLLRYAIHFMELLRHSKGRISDEQVIRKAPPACASRSSVWRSMSHGTGFRVDALLVNALFLAAGRTSGVHHVRHRLWLSFMGVPTGLWSSCSFGMARHRAVLRRDVVRNDNPDSNDVPLLPHMVSTWMCISGDMRETVLACRAVYPLPVFDGVLTVVCGALVLSQSVIPSAD